MIKIYKDGKVIYEIDPDVLRRMAAGVLAEGDNDFAVEAHLIGFKRDEQKAFYIISNELGYELEDIINLDFNNTDEDEYKIYQE